MLETSARLLQLLSLLQMRREWTGSAIAARMGVTERTVRRDIDKLRSLGYPINASPGVAGGYQLGAGAQLPPLLLDDDEALAVALGLSAVTASPVSGVAEASVRALTKLEQVLFPNSYLKRPCHGLHRNRVIRAWLTSAGRLTTQVVVGQCSTAGNDLLLRSGASLQ